jgi:hypothetical protein
MPILGLETWSRRELSVLESDDELIHATLSGDRKAFCDSGPAL